MRYFLTGGLFMMLFTSPAIAEQITVRVNGVDTNRGGRLLIMLYQQDGFPKDHSKALKMHSLLADTTEKVVTFEVQNNEYAIKVLHDEDQSGQVSKKWTGIIPSEGLGFSNGAKLSLKGPPSYKRAKMSINEHKQTTITMRYPKVKK